MKTMSVLLVLLFSAGIAFAEDSCEGSLVAEGSSITVTPKINNDQMLSVVVRTSEGKRIQCADRPVAEARQIQRLTRALAGSAPLSLEELIGLTSVSWEQLAVGASLLVAKRSYQSPKDFNQDHFSQIERIVIDGQPTAKVANHLMRSVSRIQQPYATNVLVSILKQSANTQYQVIAARMLAKDQSPTAVRALQRCANLDNRMVSAQCKRGLLREKVRATKVK